MTAAICSIASSIVAGPTEQFSPMTWTSHSISVFAMVSADVPYDVAPSSPVVIWTMMGLSDMARTAVTAARSSSRSANVSRMNPSTPPSNSPAAWRLNKSMASSRAVGPNGSIRIPRGPIAPTTFALPPAARRASVTAAALISSVFSSSPKPDNLTGFAPNVLVSRISAPHRTYSVCTPRISSGAVRFSSS